MNIAATDMIRLLTFVCRQLNCMKERIYIRRYRSGNFGVMILFLAQQPLLSASNISANESPVVVFFSIYSTAFNSLPHNLDF